MTHAQGQCVYLAYMTHSHVQGQCVYWDYMTHAQGHVCTDSLCLMMLWEPPSEAWQPEGELRNIYNWCAKKLHKTFITCPFIYNGVHVHVHVCIHVGGECVGVCTCLCVCAVCMFVCV